MTASVALVIVVLGGSGFVQARARFAWASTGAPPGVAVRLDTETGTAGGGAVDLSRPLSLEDCLRYAESHSAALRAAGARWEAAHAGIAVVGSLPDPHVTYGYFLDEVETRVGPQRQRIGVRQTLPWFGKIGLAEDAAEAAAAAERERYRGARLALQVEVIVAYVEYAYLARATEIVVARFELLRGLEAAARARYSAGEVGFADVARAQIELARLANEHETIVARREPLSARLAAALNIEVPDVLPWPEGVPDPGPAPSREKARDLLARGNPELLALDFEVSRAGSAVRLARRRFFPDLTLGLDYIVTDEAAMPVDESGKDPLVATASITFPLWFGKHAGALGAARSTGVALQEARGQRARDLNARLDLALYELDDADRKVALYEDRLVPLARQSYASADAAYRGGMVDFDSLIGAHEIALEFELGLARARADRVRKAAELDQLLGREAWAAAGGR